jgi:hypothetical protein
MRSVHPFLDSLLMIVDIDRTGGWHAVTSSTCVSGTAWSGSSLTVALFDDRTVGFPLVPLFAANNAFYLLRSCLYTPDYH